MRSRRVSAKRAAPGKGPGPALRGAGRARPASSMGFLAAPQPVHHSVGRGKIQALTWLNVFLRTGGSVEVSDDPLTLTPSVLPSRHDRPGSLLASWSSAPLGSRAGSQKRREVLSTSAEKI